MFPLQDFYAMYLDAAALSKQEGWSNNVAQKQFAA
jgi:hypothetical protein